MIWDSHGQEQQANAETRFMIQAKGFWGGCVWWMAAGCVGKIPISWFSEVFFGVWKRCKEILFWNLQKTSLQMQVLAPLEVWYRSFFLNISHPFWWFWKFDLNCPTRKWSPGTSIYQSSKVFWCSIFLDFVEQGDPFFCFGILTFWTMIFWITTFWPYFSRGKKMVKHLCFFGNFSWNFANHPQQEIHTPWKLKIGHPKGKLVTSIPTIHF